MDNPKLTKLNRWFIQSFSEFLDGYREPCNTCVFSLLSAEVLAFHMIYHLLLIFCVTLHETNVATRIHDIKSPHYLKSQLESLSFNPHLYYPRRSSTRWLTLNSNHHHFIGNNVHFLREYLIIILFQNYIIAAIKREHETKSREWYHDKFCDRANKHATEPNPRRDSAFYLLYT